MVDALMQKSMTSPIFESLERRDEEFDHDRSQCVKCVVRLKCVSDAENCVAHYFLSQFRQYRAKDYFLSKRKRMRVHERSINACLKWAGRSIHVLSRDLRLTELQRHSGILEIRRARHGLYHDERLGLSCMRRGSTPALPKCNLSTPTTWKSASSELAQILL